jgi:hypothetical protein
VQGYANACVESGAWSCWQQRYDPHYPFAIKPPTVISFVRTSSSAPLYSSWSSPVAQCGVGVGYNIGNIDFFLAFRGVIQYNLTIAVSTHLADSTQVAVKSIFMPKGSWKGEWTETLLNPAQRNIASVAVTLTFHSFGPWPMEYPSMRKIDFYVQPRSNARLVFSNRDWSRATQTWFKIDCSSKNNS